jgi:hypothetical protein
VTPPIADGDNTVDPELVELPPNVLAQLRTAGGWARFVGIVSFVLTGLAGMTWVALLVVQASQETSAAHFAGFMFPFVAAFVVAGSAASLTWRYGQDAVAFSIHGAPAPARAFRSLRQLVILWTIIVALAATWKVVVVLSKIF